MSGAAAEAVSPMTPVPVASSAGQRVVVQITGVVQDRLRLGVGQLAALPQQTITVTFQSGTGAQTHTYTGPLLLDVLNLAKPVFDPAVKNDRLRYAVTATGSDGRRTGDGRLRWPATARVS